MAAAEFLYNTTNLRRSWPTGGYSFDVTYVPDSADPSTIDEFPSGKNSLTLTGFEQDFILRGITLEVMTGDVASQGAAYGVVDESSIVKWTDTTSGHDPTQATVDVYLSTLVTKLRLWCW